MGKENALLQVQNLKKYFKTAKGQLHAVDDITSVSYTHLTLPTIA